MIDVNKIYIRVNHDLTRKSKSGYTSGDEFTRDLNDVQEILFNYYQSFFQANQRVVDVLRPFIVESYLPISGGYASLPDNYRHKIEIGYALIENAPDCGEKPTIDVCPMRHYKENEALQRAKNSIRKPSLEKGTMGFTYVGNDIKLHPSDLAGSVYLKYFRKPIQVNWGYTLDTVNDNEVYDPVTSVDLEWTETETANIINLMLFYRGLEIRENALIQWASSHQAMSANAIL